MKLLIARFARLASTFGSTLGLAAALALPSAAQCLQPDNLDSSVACGGAQTSVPQKTFSHMGLGICWQNCQVGSTGNYRVQWGNLTQMNLNTAGMSSCAWYGSRVRIFNGATLMWDGQMHLSYARTWLENQTAGTVLQVWRYLVNGDLRIMSTNGPTPCGVPGCVSSAQGLMRMTGYIDYAFDCSTQTWSRAWMLHHGCDAIDHVAGYPRAGTFHPGQSYTFVGPAAGFVPGAGMTLENGTTTSESLRRWDATALPARCGSEEPVMGAMINPLNMTCMCAAGPANYYEAQLTVFGAFGTTVTPFPGSDPFRSFPIGQWTNPAVFPGVEEVRWNSNEGSFVECTGVGRNEPYFGVTTAGGYQAFSFNVSTPSMPLSPVFVDQCNSVTLPAGNATRNRPFRSDHMLNLNF